MTSCAERPTAHRICAPFLIPPTLGPLEQGTSSVQSRAAILIKTFCWLRKPLDRRKELHPFVQKLCGS
ncbi:hypothetical protein AVEN_230660-1, partial [Araneus ventricosus]